LNMSASDAKSAEFARLFDLFERLASQRPRATEDKPRTPIVDDASGVPVLREFAPMFKTLASIVGTHTRKKPPMARPRRDTVAGQQTDAMESDSEEDYHESLAKFPLGKQYPFTFKLMLHKLYKMDDWVKKVKEALERSQIEYKPLAEQELPVKRDATEKDDENERQVGETHSRPGTVVEGGKRGSPINRPRRYSVMAAVGRKRDSPTSPTSPTTQHFPKGREVDTRGVLRAVKKRCVGRRKSLSGVTEASRGNFGGAWVYDAAVSASEANQRLPAVEFALPPLDSMQPRPRYQSLYNGERKVGRMKRRVSVSGSVGQNMPFYASTNTAGNRQRAMTIADITAPNTEQRMKMKRQFAY
ncbi:hypothetical protein BDQ12DRAFT_603673, partial [Crucibulum laeve]